MRLPLRGTSQAAGTAFFAWELSLSLLCFLKFLIYPLDALTPSGHFAGRAGAPTFLLLQKSRQKSRRKGVSPPCPRVSRRGTSACHARRRMGQRSKRLLRAKPFANLRGNSSRNAARSSAKPRFYSLFWRANCGQRPRQRDRRGGFQRVNAFGLLFCLLFCRSRKVGAPRGPSASKERIRILIGVKGISKIPGGAPSKKRKKVPP